MLNVVVSSGLSGERHLQALIQLSQIEAPPSGVFSAGEEYSLVGTAGLRVAAASDSCSGPSGRTMQVTTHRAWKKLSLHRLRGRFAV